MPNIPSFLSRESFTYWISFVSWNLIIILMWISILFHSSDPAVVITSIVVGVRPIIVPSTSSEEFHNSGKAFSFASISVNFFRLRGWNDVQISVGFI